MTDAIRRKASTARLPFEERYDAGRAPRRRSRASCSAVFAPARDPNAIFEETTGTVSPI